MARSERRSTSILSGQTGAKVERPRVGDRLDRQIGIRISRRRQELGLSSHDVGQALDFHIDRILEYESGRTHIDPTNLYRLAQMLKVPIAFFFKDQVSATSNADNSRRANAIDRFRSGGTPQDINQEGSTTLSMLFDLLEKIPSAGVRSTIVEFVRSLSEQGTHGLFNPARKVHSDSIFVKLADASEANDITME